MTLPRTGIFLLFMFAGPVASAQKLERNKQYYIAGIGFWNVENLYGTLKAYLKSFYKYNNFIIR